MNFNQQQAPAGMRQQQGMGAERPPRQQAGQNPLSNDPTEEIEGLLGEWIRRMRGLNHYMQNKGGPVDANFNPNLSNITTGNLPNITDYMGEY